MDYKTIRNECISRIKKQYGHAIKAVLFLSNNEDEHAPFRQNSNFYYLTGINDPGMALLIDIEKGISKLYYSRYKIVRDIWVVTNTNYQDIDPSKFGFELISPLGEPISGYQSSILFQKNHYELLLNDLRAIELQGGKIGVPSWKEKTAEVQQQVMIERLVAFAPKLDECFVNISKVIDEMRRSKQSQEVALLQQAEVITIAAQRAAAGMIKPGIIEKEIQVLIEGIMFVAGAELSFPSIVGSGKFSTVLHYTQNNHYIKENDLVVIDVGASYHHYCADITRTYPASGKFSLRQKEIYQIVLDTQKYIASLAKPGMWLNYRKESDFSLNHIANRYLKKRGYDQYFPHGIGHYLGLDTHDVGDYSVPLQEGDVITIEPGIYIPQEQLGVRIEDNYLITSQGNQCLSEALEKEIVAVEELMECEAQKQYSINDYLEQARRLIFY